ncbi:DNA polymerase delta subunit 3-like [Colletes gigas]|uniref:DNA polymerase delta subunit 3-like n=1 Tax=Colletes gigas TaxID=935657 RepID=UPI001C9B735B|nr:DNA polymerase delta subunit 3-like [Colletes gigas]
MIIESLDDYLETVAGYIFDNDKLVTYKWLSKELGVHVNIAKQILWEFWQRYKEEKDFDCTFLLIGVLHDGGMRVEVLKEKDLSMAKEKFTKIISEHIYSLQKILPELQMLGLAENGDCKYSAIKLLECNERSDEEMYILRWGTKQKATEIPSVPQKKVESITESIKEKKQKSPEKKSEIAKKNAQKSPEKKSEIAKKNAQKKGFNHLFEKVGNKQKSPPSTSSNAKKMEVDTSNQIQKPLSKEVTSKLPEKTEKKGGLDSFLQQGKNAKKIGNSVPLEVKESKNSTVKKITEKNVTSESNNKKKKSTRGKKRNRSKEADTAAKKRKRIMIQSDSSGTELSDEEQEEALEEPPTPEKASIRMRSPSPPKVKIEGGKHKVLKMVDKTFEEDGYLVTKKVHVYESCSDDDSEKIEVKKSPVSEPPPEPKGKKNNKQTTLMNFFTKS